MRRSPFRLLDAKNRKRAVALIRSHRDSRQWRYERYKAGGHEPRHGATDLPCPRCGSERIVRVSRWQGCGECGRSAMMEKLVVSVRKDLRNYGATDEICLTLAALYIIELQMRKSEEVEPLQLREEPK